MVSGVVYVHCAIIKCSTINDTFIVLAFSLGFGLQLFWVDPLNVF